jgi:plasmid stabilization system protein ParE
VTRIELAPEILEDFDRLFADQFQHAPDEVPGRIEQIVRAIEVLAHNPLIGRPLGNGKRELIIGRKARGYVALYHYVDEIDTVLVLAIRS